MKAFEIPIFAYSRWLLDHVGVSGLLIIAQLAYSSRVAVYSIVHDPWLVLLVEPLHGVTYGMCLVLGVTLMNSLLVRLLADSNSRTHAPGDRFEVFTQVKLSAGGTERA